MVKATFNGVVVADAAKTERVDGNHYFPPGSFDKQYYSDSNTHTTCGWKGVASYYNLNVNGKNVSDAAWYYPTPKDAAKNIAGHIAFYTNKGIKIEE
ncbi:hypothetical protein PROFUN_03290 [Planoprotostelium fungivorum]|uniref:DUF427 domain-containing protein n=1 Tax=Planoprotostelium fungivorum TaxID=1890364 RepID=A0A2P6NWS3_9EUKA|nr:hypothetical protein PROFUN_03290 [Planoprotostelium fungivorum]